MVIGRKKIYKDIIIQLALKLLDGTIEPIDFLNYMSINSKILLYFNDYAKENLIFTLENIEEKKIRVKSSLNSQISIYQLAQGFLFKNKIKYEIKSREYAFFIKMSEQCPEWFQNDFELLNSMYKNLEELVDKGILMAALEKDCKYKEYLPEWLQFPEWPVIDGIIYEFEKQTKLPDDLEFNEYNITYTFSNPKTGKKLNIVQYY